MKKRLLVPLVIFLAVSLFTAPALRADVYSSVTFDLGEVTIGSSKSVSCDFRHVEGYDHISVHFNNIPDLDHVTNIPEFFRLTSSD